MSWLIFLILAFTLADSSIGGKLSPDAKEALTCDLPGGEHMKNAGGNDGAGLCVFTSVDHAARWQNEERAIGFQQRMRAEPGGGYPEKLERMMERHCSGAPFLQYTGNDPALLRLGLRTGRMPAVTYGFSPRYGGRVAHMVNLVHLSDRWACVLDNNYPGEDQYEWMTPPEFLKRWTMGGGGWAVFLLAPPPPPIPVPLHSAWQRCRPDRPGRPCPMPLPAPLPLEKDPPPANFGIEWEKVGRAESHRFNGQVISALQAERLLDPVGNLPDDQLAKRLTVIGTKEECERVRVDLQTKNELSAWKGAALFQAYRPEAWAVRGLGFATGKPRIVFQLPPDAEGKGAVLHAQADYADGPAGLAGGLRKADPNYDPLKDPDRRKDLPGPLTGAWENWLLALVIVLSLIAGRFSLPFLGLLAKFLRSFLPARKEPVDLDSLLDSLLKRQAERDKPE
ncbi:MAG: hypothetical protein EXR99_08695 [Gemmataceae bacterium]|nr:hypothetical protein [Gemmataceae bacterium]